MEITIENDTTWGGLSDAEIERRIMLEERSQWAVPVNPVPPVAMPPADRNSHQPIQPKENTMIENQITDASAIRQVITDLNGKSFTALDIEQSLVDRKLGKSTISGFIAKCIHLGYVGKVGSDRPQRYQQFKSFTGWKAKHSSKPEPAAAAIPSEAPAVSAAPMPQSTHQIDRAVSATRGFDPIGLDDALKVKLIPATTGAWSRPGPIGLDDALKVKLMDLKSEYERRLDTIDDMLKWL
jgi:hypothetical protein